MRNFSLDRRTLLRGAGGAAVALPFLDVMRPRRASAQATPRRYVVCFAGMSLGRDNAGPIHDLLAQIVPTTLGAGYNLPLALMPLAPVQNDVSIVSGLRIPGSGPGGRDGAGFHKSTVSPLLTGVSSDGASPNCIGKTS